MAKPSLDSFIGAKPSLDSFATPVQAATPIDSRSFSTKLWDTLGGVGDSLAKNNFPGSQIGKAVGKNLYGLSRLARGDVQGFNEAADEVGKIGPAKLGGDAIRSAALPASLAIAAPASLPAAAAQYGALGAVQSGAESLTEGNSAGQAAKDATIGGGIGAVTGGVFNLIGKGISKLAPTASSVTSGVPKAAIEQASVNPAVTKQGVNMNVDEVRTKAVSSLQSLYNDLGKEHREGTALLSDASPVNTEEIANGLIQKAQKVAKDFRVFTSPSPDGILTDFSKSAIVNAGEENVVKKALQTVSTWDDFSPKGLQELNQRVNALKNFESANVTKSSAIVGKIHDEISNLINANSPELSQINSNFSKNKKVLDEISNVIGGNANKPTQVQAAVTRLDNIFKDNRDEYINIIRELGKRSGVDYLSLLAGGEFQKLLPGYIRSAVAVGSVGGVGAVATNPLSLLLLPLFSPRAVGIAARNAPAIADTTSKLTRAISTQAIPARVQPTASQ